MTSAIELTKEELDLIQKRREESRTQQEVEQDLEREAERLRIVKLANKEHMINNMILEIKSIDTNNVIIVEENTISFQYGERTQRIEIEEHVVYSDSWSRGTNKGWRYKISGSCNDYKNRYYKKAASVIKTVKDLQTALETQKRREKEKESLSKLAVSQLSCKYPNAKVTFKEHYEFRGLHGRKSEPDRVEVSTEKGTYVFSYRQVDNSPQLTFSVWERKINACVDEEIQNIVLN